MSQPFVHLHLHSEFSIADGIVRLKPLVDKCVEFKQPAVALTDWSNLYGAVKFYRACLANGVKPIIGCDVWIESPLHAEKPQTENLSAENLRIEYCDRVTLLCQNNQGYRNFSKMLTNAYLRSADLRGSGKDKIVIRWAEFAQYQPGLICMFDEHEGPVANLMARDGEESIEQMVAHYQTLFADRLYFSISRIGWHTEQTYINMVVQLSGQHQIPLVATNRVMFINQEQFEAHEIRVCINDGRVLDDSRRPRKFTDQQYLRSSTEMASLFADIPIAISNSSEIAKRCNLFLNFDEDFLPIYPDAEGRPVAVVLRELAESGLAERLQMKRQTQSDSQVTKSVSNQTNNLTDEASINQQYTDRLNLELEMIEQMGYPGYFLIVADFVRWSRDNDIPVGPGRGSGAGSLVAWATGITKIDPLLYGLLFERFLNPERVSLPDFDIDFCVDGRDRVIEYVAKRYGHDQVAQIITFGTMAAKAVVRDVGRVMSLPYGFVDQIARLIPFDLGVTLQQALRKEQHLKQRYQDETEVQELIDSALQLEGLARNVGKHAGGVVIAPKPLTEYTPLYADTHLQQAITQLDKDDLEAIGLVKFDLLGLRSLTILDCAVKLVNRQRAAENSAASDKSILDLDHIAVDDKATFKFIRTGQTTAIFQLESRGMRELIIRSHPETLEDLIALIAMFRPGPLQSGMVEDFINRKNGQQPIQYLHPTLEPILKSTYGVILYQEQVMEIARALAGYTLGGADLLRKAMGKKQPQEMAKQRKTFMDGAVSRGIGRRIAGNIFELMDKFAGYGFNKSHSAAYAVVSYHTAWLKTHYPAAYMAATLSAELDNTDKVVTLLADCKALGLSVLPPDINSSFYSFKPISDTEISYGLGALKGVGKSVIESIVEQREANDSYQDLFDFCRRLEPRKVNKRVLEVLTKSGAMDSLLNNRAMLMADISNAVGAAEQQQQDKQTGQFDMFGVEQMPAGKLASAEIADWSDAQRLDAEKETLGLYLTGHPYNRFAQELSTLCEHDVSLLDLSTPRNGIFAGIMVAMRVSNTRRGKMASITLDNAMHRVEANLYSEKFNQHIAKLQKDNLLIAVGELSAAEFTGGCQIRVENLYEIEKLRQETLAYIRLHLLEQNLNKDALQSLQQLLREYQGGKTEIGISYTRNQGEHGRLNLGKAWKINPQQALLEQLASRFGEENIRYHYNAADLIEAIPQKQSYRSKAAARY